MTGEELLDALESCTLQPGQLKHADHIHVAWLYLRTGTPAEALTRFSTSLRRFAASLGKEGIYHETITWAFMFIIHERMARLGPSASWEEFAAANPDLFTWPADKSVLSRYYRPETLRSELARKMYVMPDRAL